VYEVVFVKKSIIAAALVVSFAVVACNDDPDPTAEPTAEPTAVVTEAPAAATEAPEVEITEAPEALESPAA
jgi:hypothetical protein